MTSNIPNYMAVKDLINCGVHEGRTGEAGGCGWGGGGLKRQDVVERERKKRHQRKKRKGK